MWVCSLKPSHYTIGARQRRETPGDTPPSRNAIFQETNRGTTGKKRRFAELGRVSVYQWFMSVLYVSQVATGVGVVEGGGEEGEEEGEYKEVGSMRAMN